MNNDDLTGKRFGRWIVIEKHKRDGYGYDWLCKCECGTMKCVKGGNLKNGESKSCGCFHRDILIARIDEKRESLIGMKFDRLTVISFGGVKNREACWLCRCDCGQDALISAYSLKSGVTGSCGCKNRDQRVSTGRRNKKNLSGQRFGRLIVIKDIGRKGRKVRWLCRCDCGREVEVTSTNLTAGHSASCGCLNIEQSRNRLTTHGLSNTKEYQRVFSNLRREKEKELDAMWSTGMEFELRKFFTTCVICGDSQRLQTDHVFPLSKGYGLKPGNAIRLCISCNSRKNNKPPDCMDSKTKEKIMNAASSFLEYWNNRCEEHKN